MAKADDDLAALEAAEREADDQLSSMISDTEGEIFSDAMGNPEDENDGDQSLEQMDDPLGDDPDEADEAETLEADSEEADGEPEETAGEQRNERSERFVPSYRLREQTERVERLERELQALRMQQQQPPQQRPPQQPAPEPDIFSDPEGWKRHLRQQIMQESADMRLRFSMEEAAEEFKDEFEFAKTELLKRQNDPAIVPVVRQIESARNPGRALMAWAEPLLAEYREQSRARAAQSLGYDLEDVQRAMAMYERAQGRPVQRRLNNPPSLNGASGGSSRIRNGADSRGFDGSERSIFEDAFR